MAVVCSVTTLAAVLFNFVLLFSFTVGAYPTPGQFTEGQPWPLPWNISYYDFNHTLSPGKFNFKTAYKCDIIDQAFIRYQKLLFPSSKKWDDNIDDDFGAGNDADPSLTFLTVTISEECPTGVPQLGMDESYKLDVPSSGAAVLTAAQVWGALRGLETFSQLLFHPDGDENVYKMRAAKIRDYPRFPHRGVLLDTSRHFLPVNSLLANIDVMAHNKFNVFHWHIVDDQSFPYESKTFPNLSVKGAYSKRHIYSQDQIKSIVEYARLRGIRVVAEFDTPGHTESWGKGQPNLLCDCYDDHGKKKDEQALIDPTKQSTWDFLLALFKEILEVFPDHYIHLGGDESWFWIPSCWKNNPIIQQFMNVYGFGNDTQKVENYYFQNFLKLVDRARRGAKFIVWQEVLDNAVDASEAIAHVWKGGSYAEQMQEMATVTANGHYAMLSSCWYLDIFKYGSEEIEGYYKCDPQGFKGSVAQKNLVLGGEAALWGEMVDATNVMARLWPRASAVAERLWSDPAQTASFTDAWPRLHEMSCRLIHRGYASQPVNGPSFCPIPYSGPPS
uniref:Beta-hexosaminidase n=1 Tax=Plectus sambesii TaxID=2011161 RepID=A0A914UJ16_9BILA